MSYVPIKPLLDYATKTGIAHGAFNVNIPSQAKAIIEAQEEIRSGAIIQVAEPGLGFLGGNKDFLNSTFEEKKIGAKRIAKAVKSYASKTFIPVVLHLDHGRSFESCKMCIDAGFSSVMIDGSSLPYSENVALVKKVCKYAHKHGVSVEGELGVLAGVEDNVFADNSSYTNPMLVVDFFKKTGVDSLAISYGTKHGAVKGDNVKLRKEIAIESMENIRHEGINGYLVSHGSSLVPQYIVNEINALGGKVSGHGIPMEQLKIVIPCGISKINMDTDIRLATTRNVLEYFASHKDKQNSEIYKLMKAKPESFDYRYYLSPIMNELLGIKKEGEEAEVMEDLLKKAVKEIVLTASVSFGDVGDAKYISNISLDEMKKEYQK